MSVSFAQECAQMTAISAQYLHWTPDIFWAATPSELHAALQNPSATQAAPFSWSDFEHLLEHEHNERND